MNTNPWEQCQAHRAYHGGFNIIIAKETYKEIITRRQRVRRSFGISYARTITRRIWTGRYISLVPDGQVIQSGNTLTMSPKTYEEFKRMFPNENFS